MMNNNENQAAPFLMKTYEMVDDPSTESIVSWSHSEMSFVVWNVPEFARDLLPKYFKHSNFSSFVRQLNTYGFRKVSERWEFANDGFVRGHKQLLGTITRRKPLHSHSHTNPQPHPSSLNKSCVELGKFGIQQHLDCLRRDKNVLMQELVRLRHQQQASDIQLQGVAHRVQLMEQRQQQMMSFLSKAMHTPALLARLVHKQDDGTRHIPGVNKKRSLPNHDQPHPVLGSLQAALSDGHVFKYQPLINEAAKSMLRQILKLNTPLPDHSFKDPNAFLIDHVPAASTVADTATSAAPISQLSLSQLSHPCFAAETGYSVNHAPTMNSNMSSSTCVTTDFPNQAQVPEADMHNSLGEAIMSDLNQMQGVEAESSLKFPALSNTGAQNSALSFLDSLSTVQNGALPAEIDVFSAGAKLDGILPGSNDAFWEQFFPVSPLTDAADEVEPSTAEGCDGQEHKLGEDEGWQKLHHMKHLTEQMGLLSAEAGKV